MHAEGKVKTIGTRKCIHQLPQVMMRRGISVINACEERSYSVIWIIYRFMYVIVLDMV